MVTSSTAVHVVVTLVTQRNVLLFIGTLIVPGACYLIAIVTTIINHITNLVVTMVTIMVDIMVTTVDIMVTMVTNMWLLSADLHCTNKLTAVLLA